MFGGFVRFAVPLLLGVVLVGCGSEPEPSSLPSLSPNVIAPSPSASRTPAPSPSETSDPDADAAIAALDAYFRTANATSAGGDLREFERLFSPSCAVCMTAADNFREAKRRGDTAIGTVYQEWTIEVDDVEGRLATLRTRTDVGAIKVVNSNGDKVARFPALNDVTTVWTLRQQPNGTWLIISSTDLPS